MKKLLVRFGQFSIGSIGAALLNLILIPVTTYFLSPTEYGKTSMFLLAQTLLIYVIYLGFDQAFTREFYSHKNKKQLLTQSIFTPLLSTVVLGIVMCIFASMISKWLFASSQYQVVVYILAISNILLIFERFILLFVRMENRAITFSLYSIGIKFAILMSTTMALFSFEANFITVVYGMLIGQMVGDTLLLLLNVRLFRHAEKHIDKWLIKSLAKFGLPVAIGTFLYSLFIVMDKVFLRYFANFEELGIYAAAFKIASALMIVQVSFANFWIPTAYQWYEQQKPVRYYKNVSDAVMFTIAFFYLAVLFFKDWIVIILSPAYSEAQYIFPFLCFYPLMMTVSETTNLGIVFLKKSRLNIYVSIIALFGALLLNSILVPTYGAVGAAIATGTAYILFFLARTYFSMRIWEGFSVKRHMMLTGLLYLLPIYSLTVKNIWLERGMILVGFVLLFHFYRNELKQILGVLKKKGFNEV